jgi:hypothetical protein
METDPPASLERLQLARAEEADALCRAGHLRSSGGSHNDIRDAMQQVDACHARVATLQLQLRRVQLR